MCSGKRGPAAEHAAPCRNAWSNCTGFSGNSSAASLVCVHETRKREFTSCTCGSKPLELTPMPIARRIAGADCGRCGFGTVPMNGSPLVEMRGIYKSFGGIHAVEDASVSVDAGEALGIVGHNGAGKSTLIKILSGAHPMDRGEIRIRGERANIDNPRDAKEYGIETLYQDLALADNLDATRNLFPGSGDPDPLRHPRRRDDGTGRPGGDYARQSEVRVVQGSDPPSLRRSAPVDRHCPARCTSTPGS